MKRRKLSKEERMEVYRKCNGHCAYCGIEIAYKDMQVDHVKPLRIGGEDSIENMLPACRSCNHYKATLDVGGFRKYLADIHKRLTRDSIPYQVAERFGIVEHKTNDVLFYFEKLEGKKKMIKFCPDLTGKEEIKAVLVGNGNFVRPVLHACIKEKCIAYKDGKCRKYHAEVEVEDNE